MRQGEVVQSVRGTFVGPWHWRCDCGREGHGDTAEHAQMLMRAHWKQSDHRDDGAVTKGLQTIRDPYTPTASGPGLHEDYKP